jgi:polyhydroxyalkanoate synthesis repressor PhaR
MSASGADARRGKLCNAKASPRIPSALKESDMALQHLIRKYSNRRLYDTAASRHVTLDDLRQLIISGEKIRVVEDKSARDLTRSVLLQIICEQEQSGAPVLGSELLEMIIRIHGRPMQPLLSRSLEQAMASMVQQQESMQSEMARALQAPVAPDSSQGK